jgi:chromosome segregation ATPase
MNTNIQSINPNLQSTLATQTGETDAAKTAAAQTSPLLAGASVTVTSGATSDLEKLVARLKSESEDTKASLSKMRLASILDSYASRFGALNAEQAQALTDITTNNTAIAQKEQDLKKVQKELSAAQAQSLVMQTQIESLERAVAQAIEDGKIHRKTVQKLKEQLARDVDNEELRAQVEEAEAALANSEKALATAQADLAAAQAAAGANNSNIQVLKGKVETVEGEISALESKNRALAAKLDPSTLTKVLSILGENVLDATPERAESAAERKKAEEKELANNPANLIREAMDKADDALLDTIEKKRENPV